MKITNFDLLGATANQARRHYRPEVIVVSALLLLWLTFGELSGTPENVVLQPVHGLAKHFRMKLDMTLHKQHCGDVHVDLASVMDGTTLLDDGAVEKHRVADTPAPGACQPCGDLGGCCNTCEALKARFLQSRRPLTEVNAQPQCQEGCRVKMDTLVRPGDGSLRIIPAKATVDPTHVTRYDFNIPLLQKYGWNGSHMIHELSFAPADAPEHAVTFVPVKKTLAEGLSKVEYTVMVQESEHALPPQKLPGQALSQALGGDFFAPMFLMRFSFSAFRLASAPLPAAEWPCWLRLVLLLGGMHGLLRLWYGLQIPLQFAKHSVAKKGLSLSKRVSPCNSLGECSTAPGSTVASPMHLQV